MAEMIYAGTALLLKLGGKYVCVRGLTQGGKDQPGEITDLDLLISDLQAIAHPDSAEGGGPSSLMPRPSPYRVRCG